MRSAVVNTPLALEHSEHFRVKCLVPTSGKPLIKPGDTVQVINAWKIPVSFAWIEFDSVRYAVNPDHLTF